MSRTRPRQVVVAGAGIAGLTTSLALAEKGFSVRLFERASHFGDIGAGIQLSPNATRLLARLGVLEPLLPMLVRPDAVRMVDGRSLKQIATIPLGKAAEARWGAPYLVVHRADLHAALAGRVQRHGGVALTMAATVREFAVHADGVTVSLDAGKRIVETSGAALVAADGVWSAIRSLAGRKAAAQPTGDIAWRATIAAESAPARAFHAIANPRSVTAFVQPGSHIVAYPLRGGNVVNMVAITSGKLDGQGWAQRPDPARLMRVAERLAPALSQIIAEAGPWTAWPIMTSPERLPWTIGDSVAMIGDAAHAMSPFAAQGGAMAIEDAVTLAASLAVADGERAAALSQWEAARRERIAKVVRRGMLNRFAWHAAGPVASVRDRILALRGPDALAGDLDWLYGWRPPTA